MNTGTEAQAECSKQFDIPVGHLSECFKQFAQVSFLDEQNFQLDTDFQTGPFAAGVTG